MLASVSCGLIYVTEPQESQAIELQGSLQIDKLLASFSNHPTVGFVDGNLRSFPMTSSAEVINCFRIPTSFEVLEESGTIVYRSTKTSCWWRRCRANCELHLWSGGASLLCLRWHEGSASPFHQNTDTNRRQQLSFDHMFARGCIDGGSEYIIWTA